MKICAACSLELPKESFSKNQWQLKQHQRRCKNCVDANHHVQKKAPPKNNNDAASATEISKSPPPSSTYADNEDVSCWICLEEGVDEFGKPLVRDCSCRGESGFAHISCLIRYADQMSRLDVKDVNRSHIGFYGAWVNCHNCKQKYMNEVALDLATALVNYTNNGKDIDIVHFEALHIKLEALAQLDELKESKKIANKMLSMVRRVKLLKSSAGPDIKIYIYREAYAHRQLARVHKNEGTEESTKTAIKHFEICRDICKALGHDQGVEDAERHLINLGCSNSASKEEQLEKSQEIHKQMRERAGEESSSAMRTGIDVAACLHNAGHAIESVRMLSKIARVSKRIHGPDHKITQQAESRLGCYKKRYVVIQTERGALMFQALRYEDDGEKCVLRGPVKPGEMVKDANSSPGDVSEGKTITVDTNYLNPIAMPIVGTPVICQGLIELNHLNGKLGEIRGTVIGGKSWRYEVHFEDKGLKPFRIVKPENVHFIFELPDE